jgi:transposase-like protein
MGEALKVLVGHDAHGLSASTVSRLKSEWANEYQHWREAPLDEDRWAYIWADLIYYRDSSISKAYYMDRKVFLLSLTQLMDTFL